MAEREEIVRKIKKGQMDEREGTPQYCDRESLEEGVRGNEEAITSAKVREEGGRSRTVRRTRTEEEEEGGQINKERESC